MCGIVGYISKDGDKRSIDIGIEALKRLEYRGYDSAGLAFWDDSKEIICQRAEGRISNLEKKISKNGFSPIDPVILHTRWATHGNVCEANAHPHSDCTGTFFIVHNGIIENYLALKEQLSGEGHVFKSGTDTEVIAHLIEKFFQGNLEEAVRKSLGYLVGTYGLAVISSCDPNKIVAARLSSPLLIGLAEDHFILASDVSAVISHTHKVVYLDDGEIAIIERDKYTIIREKKAEEVEWPDEQFQKDSFSHYMLKEIMEQPVSIEQTIKGRLMLEEGYNIISTFADLSEPGSISKVISLPATVELSDYSNGTWNMKSCDSVRAEISRSIQKYGFAVIITHPQEFIVDGKPSQVNTELYRTLLRTLKENYSFKTLERLGENWLH